MFLLLQEFSFENQYIYILYTSICKPFHEGPLSLDLKSISKQ